jgi:hypothetical protein
MHRLSYNGRRLLEGYLVPTHYDRLFSTCLRDYTTDYFVTKDLTDRALIEAMSAALALQKRVHRIEFTRTLRQTNGRGNGFCGLSLIEVSIFELRKTQIPGAKLAVREIMKAVGAALGVPLTDLGKEKVSQHGGSESWNVDLHFRCMPNLRGQTRA